MSDDWDDGDPFDFAALIHENAQLRTALGAAKTELAEARMGWVREACSVVYDPDGVDIWMNASNPSFEGRRAIDLVRNGDHERVLQALGGLADGDFS